MRIEHGREYQRTPNESETEEKNAKECEPREAPDLIWSDQSHFNDGWRNWY